MTEQAESNRYLPNGSILLERYKIIRALGQGGFSITYLVFDRVLSVNAALKECFPSQMAVRESDGRTVSVLPDQQERFAHIRDSFQKEAEFTFGDYDQTGICAVKDFFEANGTVYIVEEYLPGGTFKEYLRQKSDHRVPAEELRNLFLPVMKGLAFLHEKGSIHGDISPDNLMFDGQGRMKIVDFGSSWLFAEEKRNYRTFKPGYAAPEQYLTDGIIGPWTDIYALCAVLYEALTGKCPYSAEKRKKGKELRPIRDITDLDPGVESAVLQGLQLDIPKRFFWMGTLMERLEMEDADVQKRLPETRKQWSEAGRQAAMAPSFLAAKRRRLSRRQKTLLKRTAIALAAGYGLLIAGSFLYLRMHPVEAFQIRLQQARVSAQRQKENAYYPADAALRKTLESYPSSTTDSHVTYQSIPESWFRKHHIYGNQANLFAADVDLIEDVMAYAYGQNIHVASSEFSGDVTYDTDYQDLKAACEAENTYHIRTDDADSATIIQITYDIRDNRILHLSVNGSKEAAAAFLREVFPYLAAGKYLKDAEIEELFATAHRQKNRHEEDSSESEGAKWETNRSGCLFLKEDPMNSDDSNNYSLDVSRTDDALFGWFGYYEY